MNIKWATDNYLIFVVLFIFSFIVFWYSFIKEIYFVVFLALILLLISQFKIEAICHNMGKHKQHTLDSVKIDDHELRSVLRIIDNLLGELPENKIDAFVKSMDYKHYKQLMEKLGLS